MSRSIAFNSKSTLLLLILIASVFAGLNLNLVEAQTVRIVDVHNPPQVRVGETFRCDWEVYYEAAGPITLDIQVQILDDDTDDLVAEDSLSPEIPDGVEESTTCRSKTSLTAPDSPGTWNLRAVLIGENELPFSIEVVGDDSPPLVRIVSLEADPESLQVGDPIVIRCRVEYSIPDGSRFGIRYTTSHGLPTLFGENGGFDFATGPFIIQPEGVFDPYVEILRAGEVTDEFTVPNSGNPEFGIPANAPLEPGDWTWYFRVQYFGPDEEETRLGSKELTIEVSTRTEPWVVIDFAGGPRASPGNPYRVLFSGRYFFPEEADTEIYVQIYDLDLDGIPLGDSEHFIPVHESGSGTLLEYFYPEAPIDEFSQINLTARVYLAETLELKDTQPFTIRRRVPGPVGFFSLEIDHIGCLPEAEFGSPFEVNVRVNYFLPPDIDTELNIDIIQIGLIYPLATQFVNVRGDDWRFVTLSIPPEFIPPRDGEWALVAEAWAHPESSDWIYSTYPFTVDVVGADEGISGGSSDWMVIDGWPSNPMAIEGEEMSFWAIIGIDSTDPLPQQAWLTLEIDEEEIVREAITYLEGMDQLDFQSLSPWSATPGSHTAVWTVDPDEDYVDPDRDNNQIEFTFEVAEAILLPPDGVVPGEEPSEPEEEFNFYVTADPTEGTLASSESYSVSVDLVSGEPQSVQLALIGAPAGLSYSFNPSAGDPSYDSMLTVTGSDSLPAGTYSMIINATDGVRVRYKPIILKVEKGADYELSISPSSIKGQPGETVEYAVSASSDSGYNQLVNMVVSGVPGGVTSKLEPSADKPDFQSILYLEIGEDVGVGVHTITVIGSGIEPRQVRSTLIIEEGVEEEAVREAEGKNLSYYLPLLYLAAILAAVIGGATYGIKRLRKPKKPQVFCIECGKKIPVAAKVCPKCGAKQEE